MGLFVVLLFFVAGTFAQTDLLQKPRCFRDFVFFFFFFCFSRITIARISVGTQWGNIDFDTGRENVQDLLTQRGWRTSYQMYWLNAPPSGNTWQPNWFQSSLDNNRGKSVPVFVVFHIVHLIFPNWNDKSNPLSWNQAVEPKRQAYLNEIARFGDFAALQTGDVYVVLEPEFNIATTLDQGNSLAKVSGIVLTILPRASL